MIKKLIIIFAVFAANISASIETTESEAYYIELLSPSGFRVYITDPIRCSDSDTVVPFDSFVYEYMGTSKRYRGFAEVDDSGFWVYQNTDVTFAPEHTIIFHLKSMSELDDVRNGYTITVKVPPNTPRVSV